MVSFRSDSPLSVVLFLMGCPVRSNKCTFTVHSCENILFFSSADFTWTRYDKQEQKRTEKYFIRASVEAVTTQIHPPCCLSGFSSHTHTNRDGRGGGVCALEPSSCQMWGFGWRKGGFFGWGGGGCQKLQTRTDHSRVTTNIYLEPTRVLPPVRSRVLVHALTTANRKHTRAFSKVQKKSFTARCCCCCCWTAAAQPPLHTSC